MLNGSGSARSAALTGLLVLAALRYIPHALAFPSSAFAAATAVVLHGDGRTVHWWRKPRAAMPSGSGGAPALGMSGGGGGSGSRGEDEEGGGDSPELKARDGADSLLAGQALEALEFWRTRRPSPTLPPTQVIGLLMAALQKNDEPAQNEGLKTVFEFSSGMCRRAVGGTADSFVKGARSSVFGATVGCRSFQLDPMHMVGDRLATQVVNVVASDGRRRRFLWTLEHQRRPPDAGKWLIYGVLSSDIDGKLTIDG